jgi:4-nitrophenyl phosphatase
VGPGGDATPSGCGAQGRPLDRHRAALEVSAPVIAVRPRAVLCDLDGVVWLARQPIPGSVEAVARIRAMGCRVIFVTNNSAARLAEQEGVLAGIGIPAPGDVLSSAGAAAGLVAAGDRVLVCGGAGVVEAVEVAGATAVPGDDATRPPVDAVMVGFHREFDYERMRIASWAVRDGAQLIATNDDATYPTPEGPIPGGGAILAAVSTASGVVPIVAGKPYPPMVDAVTRMLPDIAPPELLMIGDRLETDGKFAAAIGCGFALVRSGVTPPGLDVAFPAAIDAADLAHVADVLERLPAPRG